ncbi:PspC domain-containing protein [Actinomadura macrotermitis]|nr:PspC domain-containing protein [Actinomadura macrotermitis]
MAEQPVKEEQTYKRIARVPEGRIIAGVCTGLGRYTGIDPVVFRVGFGILVLAHGQGILLYIAAALLMPAAPDTGSLAEQLFKRWFDGNAVLALLGALLCLGVAGTLVGGGVSTDSIATLTVFGLVLLVAHARGVDLAGVARGLPERMQGHPPTPGADPDPAPGPISLDKYVPSGGGVPDGMIDLAAYGASDTLTRPPAAPRKDKRSPLTFFTVLAACGVGAATVPLARSHPEPQALMIVAAAALAVVGGGLLLGGFFRVHGLATVGTLLTFTLLAGGVANEVPKGSRFGDVEWRPVDMTSAQQAYRLGVGTATLDLTALPVRSGQRVVVSAEVLFGELNVRLPAGARVELNAQVGLGDLKVRQRTFSGPNARTTQVLEPEGGPADPPVIELRVRGRFGDVEVSHG